MPVLNILTGFSVQQQRLLLLSQHDPQYTAREDRSVFIVHGTKVRLQYVRERFASPNSSRMFVASHWNYCTALGMLGYRALNWDICTYNTSR